MRVPLIAIALVVCTASLGAQKVTLTVTGGNAVNFPNPTVANYVAGFVDNPVPITFSLATSNGGGLGATVTITVEICSVNATLGTGKALSDLKWRPGDLSKPFVPVVQGCNAPVSAGRTVTVQQMGRSATWTLGSILLEMDLHWATDVQPSYGTPLLLNASIVSP